MGGPETNRLSATSDVTARLREEVLPLPDLSVGFPRLLMVGTTGAGKTTLVRQLLGTDPDVERFPSTSTAKTTVADTEVIVDSGADRFQAVVTFVGRYELEAAIQECFLQCALGVIDGLRESELLRRLLEHPEQRFRFRYLVGNVQVGRGASETDSADLVAARELVFEALEAIRTFVIEVREDIEDDFRKDGRDVSEADVVEELEAEITRLLADDTIIVGYQKHFLALIASRFGEIVGGVLEQDETGWPTRWQGQSADRAEFIETVNYFSSNHAARFGRLLTPLVNGIRVSGPFVPAWADDVCNFVLIDVEGFGHTPGSSASVSTRLVEYFDRVDTIVLVDNAQQPMQAAPIAAIRAVLTSGHLEKLAIVFTHLDLVKGDNLATFEDREDHVMGSAENVVVTLGKELATHDELRLRHRLQRASVLLAGIDRKYESSDERTAAGLRRLLRLSIPQTRLPPQETVPTNDLSEETRPIYELAQFDEAVRDASGQFRDAWRGRLGRAVVPDVPKEHWARIKALTRRLGEFGHEEYDSLRPTADLSTALREAVYRVTKSPSGWTHGSPNAKARDEVLDKFANDLASELAGLSRQRVWRDRRREWLRGYEQAGKGSTRVRAEIVDIDIYASATACDDSIDSLLGRVREITKRLAAGHGVVVRHA